MRRSALNQSSGNSDQTAVGLLGMQTNSRGNGCSSGGDLKLQWGKFTDDELQQIERSSDKILSMLQEQYGAHYASSAQERMERRGRTPELGGSVASAFPVGRHEATDALTGNNQSERHGVVLFSARLILTEPGSRWRKYAFVTATKYCRVEDLGMPSQCTRELPSIIRSTATA